MKKGWERNVVLLCTAILVVDKADILAGKINKFGGLEMLLLLLVGATLFGLFFMKDLGLLHYIFNFRATEVDTIAIHGIVAASAVAWVTAFDGQNKAYKNYILLGTVLILVLLVAIRELCALHNYKTDTDIQSVLTLDKFYREDDKPFLAYVNFRFDRDIAKKQFKEFLDPDYEWDSAITFENIQEIFISEKEVPYDRLEREDFNTKFANTIRKIN